MAEARRVEIAVCEKHGLRYNAAEGQGCVRCRREAGVSAGPPAATARAAAPGAAPSEASPSVPSQLLLAALLVAGTGAMFWTAHQQVVESFGTFFGMSAGGPGASTDAFSMEEDGLGSGEPAGGAAPAAYPPDDTVAVGPAAQEQQMRELMRQMEEDARIEAQDAAHEAERNAERDQGLPDAGDGADYDAGPDE